MDENKNEIHEIDSVSNNSNNNGYKNKFINFYNKVHNRKLFLVSSLFTIFLIFRMIISFANGKTSSAFITLFYMVFSVFCIWGSFTGLFTVDKMEKTDRIHQESRNIYLELLAVEDAIRALESGVTTFFLNGKNYSRSQLGELRQLHNSLRKRVHQS